MASKMSPLARRRKRSSSAASMSSNGNGSHSVCSFANSSQYAFGRISDRVDSVWPILTKLGPRSSNMARNSSGAKPLRKWCLLQDVGYLPQAAHARPAVQVEPVLRDRCSHRN